MFYEKYIYIFLLYIKISGSTNLTYYQRNRDMVLNKAKDYYKNNKESLRKQGRGKYKNLSEEEKIIKRKYGKNRYHNMSDEKKQKLKEYQKNYHDAKKNTNKLLDALINLQIIMIYTTLQPNNACIKLDFIIIYYYYYYY